VPLKGGRGVALLHRVWQAGNAGLARVMFAAGSGPARVLRRSVRLRWRLSIRSSSTVSVRTASAAS